MRAFVTHATLTAWGERLAARLGDWLPEADAHRFVVVHHDVTLPHLPAAFAGFRLVQLSDSHFYQYSSDPFHQDVVQAIADLQPDALVLTGDIIHFGDRYLDLGLSVLRQLSAAHGKYACMGNHDYCDDHRGQAVQAMLAEAGFTVLVNRAIPLEKDGRRLWLSGLDDIKKGRPDPGRAFGVVEPGHPHIALAHNPTLAPRLARQERAPHMILSGHTHGGHIDHPGFNWLRQGAFRMPFQYGWFQLADSRLYVTSGIGSASITVHTPYVDFCLPPFRINTTPEIAVFTLQPG